MLASGAGLATLLAILSLPSQQVEGTAARGGLYSGPMASVQSSRGWRVVVGLLFHLCLQSTRIQTPLFPSGLLNSVSLSGLAHSALSIIAHPGDMLRVGKVPQGTVWLSDLTISVDF